jgi:hypothetical protein
VPGKLLVSHYMKTLITAIVVLIILIIGYASNYYITNNVKIMAIADDEMGGQGAFLNPKVKTEYFIGFPYIVVENIVYRPGDKIKILRGKTEVWFFKWKIHKFEKALFTPSI